MLARWRTVANVRVIAHLWRALGRFRERLGMQFAASIAYFSVVSLVPILMLCFSALGLALTVFYKDALAQVETWIYTAFSAPNVANVLGNDDTVKDIIRAVNGALNNWWAIGAVGLVAALWLGSAWMGTLKRAVRVQLRPHLGVSEKRLPLPLDVLANWGMLAVLLVGVVVTFAAVPMTLMVGSDVLTAIGLPGTGWRWLGRAASIVVSLVVGTGLFWVLFRMCAVDPVPHRVMLIGSVVGSVALAVVQTATTYLIGLFTQNVSAALFGPLIVLMLFLHAFATLILFVAAWMGTWEEPRPAEPQPVPALVEPEDARVSMSVAEQSMRVGLGAGGVVGAAAGVGLGALVTWFAHRRSRRGA